jgi:hypothetical protein
MITVAANNVHALEDTWALDYPVTETFKPSMKSA